MENTIEIKNRIENIWDQCGETYDDDYVHGLKSDQEKKEWLCLFEKVILKKPSKILDVGTGTGFLSLLLSELGHECKGIDLSSGMLSYAKKKAKKEKLTAIKFEIGDAENLRDLDQTYDVVINRHLVWTLPNPQKAINEWVRVLKPGGQLIIIDGDWFYKSSWNGFKIFLGKCIISINERRNAFKGIGNYDQELTSKLPMMHDENARQLVELVENAGLEVMVRDAKAIEKVEKERMSWGYQLKNPYKRTIIVGKKGC